MKREALLATFLTLTAFAGCIEAPEDLEAAAVEAEQNGLLEQYQAVVGGEATIDDWHLLTARATPEAGLASFWWTVPEGAAVPSEWFDGKYDTTTLEVAPIVPEGMDDAVTEWALFAFVEDDGKLHQISSAVFTPVNFSYESVMGGGDEEGQAPELEPFFMSLGFDVLEEGDRVGLVLAARATQPIDFGLGLRALDHEPDWSEEEPADETADFVEAREGRQPLALQPAGVGSGLHVALLAEGTSLFLFPGTWAAWNDKVVVEGGHEPDLRPVAAGRHQTVSTAFDTPAGYSMAMAYYHNADAVGEWTAAADIHGEVVDAGGPIAAAGFAGLTGWLVGGPAFFALGDGEGAATSALALDVTGTSREEFLMFVQMGIGSDLQTLLGDESETGTFVMGGLMGGAQPDARTFADADGHLRSMGAGQPALLVGGLAPRA